MFDGEVEKMKICDIWFLTVNDFFNFQPFPLTNVAFLNCSMYPRRAFLMFLHFCSTEPCLACPNDSGWAVSEALKFFLHFLFAFPQLCCFGGDFQIWGCLQWPLKCKICGMKIWFPISKSTLMIIFCYMPLQLSFTSDKITICSFGSKIQDLLRTSVYLVAMMIEGIWQSWLETERGWQITYLNQDNREIVLPSRTEWIQRNWRKKNKKKLNFRF